MICELVVSVCNQQLVKLCCHILTVGGCEHRAEGDSRLWLEPPSALRQHTLWKQLGLAKISKSKVVCWLVDVNIRDKFAIEASETEEPDYWCQRKGSPSSRPQTPPQCSGHHLSSNKIIVECYSWKVWTNKTNQLLTQIKKLLKENLKQ